MANITNSDSYKKAADHITQLEKDHKSHDTNLTAAITGLQELVQAWAAIPEITAETVAEATGNINRLVRQVSDDIQKCPPNEQLTIRADACLRYLQTEMQAPLHLRLQQIPGLMPDDVEVPGPERPSWAGEAPTRGGISPETVKLPLGPETKMGK